MEVAPLAFEHERTKAGFLKVALDRARGDAVILRGIEQPLNHGHIRALRIQAAAMSHPVLHDHRHTGGAAPFVGLPDERHIHPHAGRRRDRARSAYNDGDGQPSASPGKHGSTCDQRSTRMITITAVARAITI